MTRAVERRDHQRSKVYAAENTLRWLYDNGTGRVELAGTILQLEPEARFAGVESIQVYVDRVLSLPVVVERFGRHDRVTVRARKGGKSAHYEYDTRTIAVHLEGSRWALRELVLLHEIAHAVSSESSRHGPDFAATLVELIGIVMGPQAALALRLLHAEHGVQ